MMPGAAPLLPPPGRDPREVPPAGSLPSALPNSGTDPVQPAPVPQLAPPNNVPAALPTALPARRRKPLRQELTTAQREVSAAEEIAFATIETELGGRAQMVAVLASADLNQDEGKILGLLADPLNDGLSLAKVCLGGGLKMTRLLKLFQAAALAKGQTAAISRIAGKLPDVAASVMEDAVGGKRMCEECKGYGVVKKPTKEDPGAEGECPECRGRCEVYFHPEANVRELALRIGGLLEKGGGGAKILINNQQVNTGSAADSASYDRLMAQLDTALYGAGRDRQQPPADVVDGEVLE